MRAGTPDLQPIPDDYGITIPILEGGPLWFASKNRTYRETLRSMLKSFHDFLSTSGLYSVPGRAGRIDEAARAEYLEACLRKMEASLAEADLSL